MLSWPDPLSVPLFPPGETWNRLGLCDMPHFVHFRLQIGRVPAKIFNFVSRDFQRFEENIEFEGISASGRLADVTDFVMSAQKRLAGNSVIVQVMWPWSDQWENTLRGREFQLYSKFIICCNGRWFLFFCFICLVWARECTKTEEIRGLGVIGRGHFS